MKRRLLLAIILSFLLVACGQSLNHTPNTPVNDKQQTNHLKDNHNEPNTNHQLTNENNSSENETAANQLNELKVHYIDVGQADATLFQFSHDDKPITILYDAGDWNQNNVIQYLTAQEIDCIDLVIISHPDADHTGQLADVMHTFEVGEVWLSGNTSTSLTFQQGLEAVLESGADYYEPRAGDQFDIGPLKIDVLHPSGISGKLNEESISLFMTYGQVKFVFTGDAGANDELTMIKQKKNVQADILHLGHHGSNTSTDPAFLKAVNPNVAIYSAGTDNSYGHPHPDVVSRVQDAGITLYGTDIHGTILVTTDGIDYSIATQKDGTVSPKSTESAKQTKTEPEQKKPDHDANSSQNCIDINKASIDELQNIIHIGRERAQELIDLRPFDSIDDLDQLKGIGPARIADIKDEGLACVK